jgi:argininosuccinate lyase
VVGFLVKEHGMSYRTGHQVLALMMQTVADRNIPPSQATPDMLEGAIEKYTGKKIKVPRETLARLFDAMACGGAAPERVAQHIAAARKNLAADRAHVVALVAQVEAARRRLESAFALVREKAGLRRWKLTGSTGIRLLLGHSCRWITELGRLL